MEGNKSFAMAKNINAITQITTLKLYTMETAIKNLNNTIESRERIIYEIMLATKTTGNKDYDRKEQQLLNMSFKSLKDKHNKLFNK